MPSAEFEPSNAGAQLNTRILGNIDGGASLMERATRNAALLQQIDQQKLRFAQDMALSDQALQENRLRLTQLQGAQAVNAEQVRTDVALEQQKYQALQSNLQELQQASTDLPGVLDAINRETDPFRLRDAAIAFHGRYAHLAQDPVLAPRYAALDGRLAARLQARGEEFRARISTAADALRPHIDPGSPENLTAIRQSPLYRFARLDPAFARQIDDATQQAAVAPAIPAISSAQADRPLAHGGDFAVSFASLKPSTSNQVSAAPPGTHPGNGSAVTLAALNPSTSAQASAAPPGSNTSGGFTITVPGLKPPAPTPPPAALPNTSTNARRVSTVTDSDASPSTPPQPSPSNPSSKAPLTLSKAGLDFLEKREGGFHGKIYLDQAKNPTIGYGHKLLQGEAEKYKNGITLEQAADLLRRDLAKAEAAVRRNVTVDLEQEQHDALVSFAYNAGLSPNSALVKKLNNGEFTAVPEEMARWNKVKNEKGEHVPSRGLSNRRWREGMLWHGFYDPDSLGMTPPGKQ